MSTTTPDADLRCPQCAAHVRSGSDWCTLCYADLRPAPAQAPTPEPAPVPLADPAGEGPTSAAGDALLQTYAAGHHALATSATGAADPPAPRRGKHAKHSSRSSAEETEALAAQLLAQLAVHESGAPLGKLSTLTDTTGKKVGLMIGGAAAMTLLVFALMALVGALL